MLLTCASCANSDRALLALSRALMNASNSDRKPENVLANRDGGFIYKIFDFGFSMFVVSFSIQYETIFFVAWCSAVACIFVPLCVAPRRGSCLQRVFGLMPTPRCAAFASLVPFGAGFSTADPTHACLSHGGCAGRVALSAAVQFNGKRRLGFLYPAPIGDFGGFRR